MTHAASSRAPDDGIVARAITDLPGDRSVAWAQMGSGPDCLVIHGTLMALEDSWIGPAPALAERFCVTCVDRPGHGHSRRQRVVDASPQRQAALLHDFAEAIGLHRPVLVGHSFGGTVALAYATQYPDDVGGLVALAPLCQPEPRMETILLGPRGIPIIGDIISRMAGASSDPLVLPLLWRAMFLPEVMPKVFAEGFPFALASRSELMIAEGEDAAAVLPALAGLVMRYVTCHVPTRILGGTADAVVNNVLQGRIAAFLMPNASFQWLDGQGHMLHHFAQREVLDAACSVHAVA